MLNTYRNAPVSLKSYFDFLTPPEANAQVLSIYETLTGIVHYSNPGGPDGTRNHLTDRFNPDPDSIATGSALEALNLCLPDKSG